MSHVLYTNAWTPPSGIVQFTDLAVNDVVLGDWTVSGSVAGSVRDEYGNLARIAAEFAFDTMYYEWPPD